LRKLSRTVRADGFRPGKVPMSVVAQRYGYSVQSEVLNDKVGQVFSQAVSEAKLRVAGPPRITRRRTRRKARWHSTRPSRSTRRSRSATWRRRRWSGSRARSPTKRSTRRFEILRKQRRTFQQRPAAEAAAAGDRVTIDFRGTIDGTPFEGGTASDFAFRDRRGGRCSSSSTRRCAA
jgi:trigger factor